MKIIFRTVKTFQLINKPSNSEMTLEENPQTKKSSTLSEDEIVRLYAPSDAINPDPEKIGKIIDDVLGDDIRAMMKAMGSKTQKPRNSTKTGETADQKKEIMLVDDLVSIDKSEMNSQEKVAMQQNDKAFDLFHGDDGLDEDEILL
ncbi:hypothetical protein KEM56_000719 [Ascosphaera pollenicola]|nr:hypothetical protein KEM56_000719 [Ascosphaera pollenicola]